MKLTLICLTYLAVAISASDIKKAPIAVPAKEGDGCVYHARTKRAGKPVVHKRICNKKSAGKCKWEDDACKKVNTSKPTSLRR